jgi:hypothetical protein
MARAVITPEQEQATNGRARGGPASRPEVACIAWVPSDTRPGALAAELGGEARTFFDLRIVHRPLVPLRYLVSAVRTAWYLVRRRPRSVIVQAPPVPAAALAWGYGLLARSPVVIDSHPAAFGLDGVLVDRVMLPLLAWLAKRTRACIVATDELADKVQKWGGRALVVHEGPPPAQPPAAANFTRPSALFVCTFAPDEPVVAVIEAARRLPEVEFRITGDPRRRPAGLARTAPPNVKWLGFLGVQAYWRALGEASVILCLTNRGQAVLRSAYEAVYARRPLVTTGWPHMTELFPYALPVANEDESIAGAVRSAIARHEELSAVAAVACEAQTERWLEQLQPLRAALALRSEPLPAQNLEATA